MVVVGRVGLPLHLGADRHGVSEPPGCLLLIDPPVAVGIISRGKIDNLGGVGPLRRGGG